MHPDYKAMIGELEKLFVENKRHDAWVYLKAMLEWYHDIDDIIDEKITDPRFIIRTWAKASSIYSCNFYQANSHHLWMIEQMVIELYQTSVEWQDSKVEWQKQHGDCLRHSGINMIVAVILICFGQEESHKWGTKLREFAHADLLKKE